MDVIRNYEKLTAIRRQAVGPLKKVTKVRFLLNVRELEELRRIPLHLK